MSSLEELIAELEKATGPSREIDAQIWLFATPGATRRTSHVVSSTGAWEPYDIDETRDETGRLIIVPSYTRSLDAAVALVNRVLPGFGWDVASNTSHIKACLNPEFGKPIGKHPHWAAVSDTSSKKFEDGATPALALCIATLRAKLAQEEA